MDHVPGSKFTSKPGEIGIGRFEPVCGTSNESSESKNQTEWWKEPLIILTGAAAEEKDYNARCYGGFMSNWRWLLWKQVRSSRCSALIQTKEEMIPWRKLRSLPLPLARAAGTASRCDRWRKRGSQQCWLADDAKTWSWNPPVRFEYLLMR